MSTNDTFLLGGSTPIRRLGYGAMRITGPGVWGDPPDRDGAVALLRSLPALGVDFIDTADSYGPNVSEELIRDALAPYGAGTVVATKAGLARTGPGNWVPLGRPEYLIQQAYASLRRLGVERIDLWQLHRIDPAVPRGEQFGAIAWLLEQGVIRHAGLSEVGVADIEEARRYFPVATVQNRYNLAERQSEDVLAYAQHHGIGFIPWFPLAAGSLLQPGGVLDAIARRHGATPGQVALAWLLRRSPVMLPIPGTSSMAHLRENLGAWEVVLSDEEFAALSKLNQ
nr:aldo/keto reductase [uncultured Massilia sp.]